MKNLGRLARELQKLEGQLEQREDKHKRSRVRAIRKLLHNHKYVKATPTKEEKLKLSKKEIKREELEKNYGPLFDTPSIGSFTPEKEGIKEERNKKRKEKQMKPKKKRKRKPKSDIEVNRQMYKLEKEKQLQQKDDNDNEKTENKEGETLHDTPNEEVQSVVPEEQPDTEGLED